MTARCRPAPPPPPPVMLLRHVTASGGVTAARAQMDLQEFSAAIARIEDGVLGRFGSAVRLFEAVAFGTQRQSQVSVVAEGRVSCASWTIAELERVFAAQPAIAAKLQAIAPPRTKWTRRVPHPVLIGHAASAKLQAIWAVKLAMKLKETTAYIGLGGEPAGAGAAPAPRGDDAAGAGVKAGDYGFPSSFLWGSGGDFGPLEIAVRPRPSRPIAPAACARPRARRWARICWALVVGCGALTGGDGSQVPGSAWRMALWQFGREYNSLRRAFRWALEPRGGPVAMLRDGTGAGGREAATGSDGGCGGRRGAGAAECWRAGARQVRGAS